MKGIPSHSPIPQTEIHSARDSLISGYSYLSTLGHGKCAPESPTPDPPARQDLERVGRQAGSCGHVLIPGGWAIGFNDERLPEGRAQSYSKVGWPGSPNTATPAISSRSSFAQEFDGSGFFDRVWGESVAEGARSMNFPHRRKCARGQRLPEEQKLM